MGIKRDKLKCFGKAEERDGLKRAEMIDGQKNGIAGRNAAWTVLAQQTEEIEQ